MKKIAVIISLIFLISTLSLAQGVFVDSRLDVVYTEDYLDNLVENNPEKLDFLNWSLDNSYFIADVGLEKCEQLPYLKYFDPDTKSEDGIVENIDLTNVNILLYSFERQHDRGAYYRIGETGKAICFYSFSKLTKIYNNYQDEK